MRYVSAVNTGKGFITHADRSVMSFAGQPNNIWNVDGDSGSIDSWITRVGGSEKTQGEADAQVLAVTKYLYTSREFLIEVLSPAETKFLIENYGSSTPIRNFLNRVLDFGVDVSSSEFLTFINAVRDAGHLTQARVDEITAGRVA